MTILYQIYIYRKDNISYEIDKVIEENKCSNDSFVNGIVYGTLEKEQELDTLINKYMKDWVVSRLGKLDQAIFRMSAYELLYTDTPAIVVINEAIELAKKYSDDSVRKIINAVLDKVNKNEVDE